VLGIYICPHFPHLCGHNRSRFSFVSLRRPCTNPDISCTGKCHWWVLCLERAVSWFVADYCFGSDLRAL
jgi:hypothetical protein